MSLTAKTLDSLRPQETTYTKTDRDGLFIEVLPSGKMVWRYKFHFEGRRPRLTIGPYPEIGLAAARKKRAAAAELLAEGINPAADKQEKKAQRKVEIARAFTFRKLAEKWFEKDIAHKSEKWRYTVRNWLNLDVYPAIGDADPRRVTQQHIRAILDKIVLRGSPNSANKVRLICWQIFEFAIRHQEIPDANPVARIELADAPKKKSHRALGVKEIKPFFEALEKDDSRLINKIAIKLLLLTLTRKSELRLAKWHEFDLEEKVWRIPGHRMKMGLPHEVYLSRQVLDLLEQLRPFGRENGFILPGASSQSKAIGHTTLNSIIDRLDIDGTRFVPHGFRATASTLLNGANFKSDAIERQLAHKDPNIIRGTYNQSEYSEIRRDMLQAWADHIDNLISGKNSSLRGRSFILSDAESERQL